jgi:hypothetical protein
LAVKNSARPVKGAPRTRLSGIASVNMENNFPPDLEMLSHMIDGQSPQVRELFHYALVMLMVENGKAEITERHHIDNLEYLTITTTAGDPFEILTPQVSDERLQQLRTLAREILRQDRAGKEDNAAS